MAGTVLRYFAGGNTSQGFYSLFDSNLQGLDHLYILKGGPGTGKSSIIKKVAKHFSEQGFDIELIHCSSDSDSLDGVIIPILKAGIVDGTTPHVIEPKTPGAVEELINLGEAWDRGKLVRQREQIVSLTNQVSEAFQAAYEAFAEALVIHDEWERLYIQRMDFSRGNQIAEHWVQRLFGSQNKTQDRMPRVRRRFLGAATPIGPVDFVPNLTQGIEHRYLLKGRPGTGKSTLLKKIAEEAIDRGFDTEIYHCGFDPTSVDMVIVRELNFAMFDSTSPHAYEPEYPSDEVIDLYELTVEPGTDEQVREEVERVAGKYRAKMKEGTASLARAKQIRDGLEQIYIEAMDFTIVDRFTEQMQAELEALNH